MADGGNPRAIAAVLGDQGHQLLHRHGTLALGTHTMSPEASPQLYFPVESLGAIKRAGDTSGEWTCRLDLVTVDQENLHGTQCLWAPVSLLLLSCAPSGYDFLDFPPMAIGRIQ